MAASANSQGLLDSITTLGPVMGYILSPHDRALEYFAETLSKHRARQIV
jgi:hypothetical protein